MKSTHAPFDTLPIWATFEIDGIRWIKTSEQRAQPVNRPGPSYQVFAKAHVKPVVLQQSTASMANQGIRLWQPPAHQATAGKAANPCPQSGAW
jgi:hypothetical protein